MRRIRIGRIDAPLLLIVVALTLFGLVMVFSASYYSTITQDLSPYYYLQRAAMWTGIGIVVLIVFSFVMPRVYQRWGLPALLLAIVLLAALFTPLGISAGGATRAIGVG